MNSIKCLSCDGEYPNIEGPIVLNMVTTEGNPKTT